MVCTSKCIRFEEMLCTRRDRFVGACNCYPYVAQKNYEYTLKDARQGVNLNTTY